MQAFVVMTDDGYGDHERAVAVFSTREAAELLKASLRGYAEVHAVELDPILPMPGVPLCYWETVLALDGTVKSQRSREGFVDTESLQVCATSSLVHWNCFEVRCVAASEREALTIAQQEYRARMEEIVQAMREYPSRLKLVEEEKQRRERESAKLQADFLARHELVSEDVQTNDGLFTVTRYQKKVLTEYY